MEIKRTLEMASKMKNNEFMKSVIDKVDIQKDCYEVRTVRGWSLIIYKKYGVKPKAGDIIITYGKPFTQIQGIEINGKVLFYNTDEEMDKKHKEWIKKTAKRYKKEHIELMEKIKDEESFETVNISGMGSGYERTCQIALRAGIEFLKQNPEFHFDYQHFKNVYGLTWSDTPWCKKLDKVLEDATKLSGGMTGAIHQCVIGHLQFIHKHSVKEWLETFPEERRYMYPKELPESSFGKWRNKK